ncbi:MAG: hypothetical protein IT184_12335 [Acidobacteria bacterium]|nr:hypothetical protein [Acidobacteriota bacterium]
MTYRQFVWGLSTGIGVLATAGAFWLILGVLRGLPQAIRDPPVSIGFAVIVAGTLAILLKGIVKLRIKATGFNLAELRRTQTPSARRAMRRAFLLVNAGQFVATGSLVAASVSLGRPDFIWPLIGIVLGLHFLPLASLFRLRAYYVLGIAVACVSAIALLFDEPARMLLLGTGVGGSLWMCAVYLLLNADAVAVKAVAGAGVAPRGRCTSTRAHAGGSER